MKSKIFLGLAIVCSVLSFVGSSYVLRNDGAVSPGYATIPAMLCMLFLFFYEHYRPKKR